MCTQIVWELTEVGGVVVLGAVEAEAGEEGYDVLPSALEHALAVTHDVHVVELGEESSAGGVHAADDGAAAVR